ncbi:TPA: asparaginase [Candidatus Shapirobacteria bacterium]|nr:asparaginase [Candidatus Shapirobacteria bacterium]
MESRWYKSLCIIQDEFTRATSDFYREKGIRFFHFPITTGSISSPMGLGSDSTPVKIQIDGVETYLADSMQFFLEYACRLNKEGAYYIAPSFRGEKADKRHLSQFLHSEAEIPGGLDDVIELCQNYLSYLVNHLLSKCEKEIVDIAGDVNHLTNFLEIAKSIPRCTFDEAVKILDNSPLYVTDNGMFRTINSAGEKQLIGHFNGYVWLTNFDHMAVPFYQKFDPKDETKALNADLLMGIGETIGSGQRHSNGEEVKKALNIHDVDKKPYEWYIYMKEKYPIQTSGFGMGIERFILWLLKHDDIRDCQLLPRFNGIESAF